MDTEEHGSTDYAARGRRRRRRRLVRRIVITVIAIPLGVACAAVGPLLLMSVFLPVMLVLITADWLLDANRRSERREDLRKRRRRQMQEAMDRGGPSDAPASPHVRADPGEAERTLFGRKMPSLVSGIWPRGRI